MDLYLKLFENKMKDIFKNILICGIGMTSISLCFSDWNSTDNPYANLPTTQDIYKTDLSQEAQKTTLDAEQKWLSQQILEVYWLKWEWQWATNYVKFVVNLALSLLFFVCVALLIYGFYMIIISNKQEDAYKKALKILYAAWFWIVVIWLSFFIAQVMFWIYFKAKDETSKTAPSTNTTNWVSAWPSVNNNNAWNIPWIWNWWWGWWSWGWCRWNVLFDKCMLQNNNNLNICASICVQIN